MGDNAEAWAGVPRAATGLVQGLSQGLAAQQQLQTMMFQDELQQRQAALKAQQDLERLNKAHQLDMARITEVDRLKNEIDFKRIEKNIMSLLDIKAKIEKDPTLTEEHKEWAWQQALNESGMKPIFKRGAMYTLINEAVRDKKFTGPQGAALKETMRVSGKLPQQALKRIYEEADDKDEEPAWKKAGFVYDPSSREGATEELALRGHLEDQLFTDDQITLFLGRLRRGKLKDIPYKDPKAHDDEIHASLTEENPRVTPPGEEKAKPYNKWPAAKQDAHRKATYRYPKARAHPLLKDEVFPRAAPTVPEGEAGGTSDPWGNFLGRQPEEQREPVAPFEGRPSPEYRPPSQSQLNIRERKAIVEDMEKKAKSGTTKERAYARQWLEDHGYEIPE